MQSWCSILLSALLFFFFLRSLCADMLFFFKSFSLCCNSLVFFSFSLLSVCFSPLYYHSLSSANRSRTSAA